MGKADQKADRYAHNSAKHLPYLTSDQRLLFQHNDQSTDLLTKRLDPRRTRRFPARLFPSQLAHTSGFHSVPKT